MELTERKRQILKVVVEDYVRTAEPVGSKTIAARMGGSVSSATIRNELADLVELGYLEQPHTSAGRIPSPKGYRLYVNELMERQRLSVAETEKINQSLQMKMEELDRVISQAGKAVSSFVNYPAYAATAVKSSVTASRFDLLPVDEKSCIVVMMMGDRVKSQLLRLQLKVDRDQMSALVELLNRHFTGISTKEMNERLMAVAQGITPQLFLLLSQTVNYAVEMLEEADRTLAREYRTYMRGQMEFEPERNFYPDANLTLRVAYGAVEGYNPEDGVRHLPVTTLEGIIAKDNPDIYDYDVPDALRRCYEEKDYGRWAVNVGTEEEPYYTVPVAFLATNHTTGGNSGSPVLNGDGELVGINFDRTWLSTMSDLEFDPAMCRNISVDIRYVLFVIEKIGGAGYLIDEMTLR